MLNVLKEEIRKLILTFECNIEKGENYFKGNPLTPEA